MASGWVGWSSTVSCPHDGVSRFQAAFHRVKYHVVSVEEPSDAPEFELSDGKVE